MNHSPFLTVPEVAARHRCSEWTVHEKARRGELPHRKYAAGSSRLIFTIPDLEAYESGEPLEVIELNGGGRIVRPIRKEGI